MLALHCGMRRGELLGLEWSRVDRSAGLIYLEAEHTKAKKRRAVPLAAVRDVLGLASVVMTERYARLGPEGTRSALNKLAASESRFGHVVDLVDRRESA